MMCAGSDADARTGAQCSGIIPKSRFATAIGLIDLPIRLVRLEYAQSINDSYTEIMPTQERRR
jgi:hypothetical protein